MKNNRVVTRRTTNKWIGLIAALLLSFPTVLTGQNGAAEPKNFLFLLTDDQRWDAMSCAGSTYIQTPNMDRIAEEGIRFENAFVTTSLCSPSRATFLTGKYAHSHGVITNAEVELRPDEQTFPSIMQQHGYATAYIGKWHMGHTDDSPRPGFDHWVSYRGQGVYFDPVLNVNGKQVEEKGHTTDVVTNYAVDWLKQSKTLPFCLYVGFKAVHAPFTPPTRYQHIYDSKTADRPETSSEDISDKPSQLRERIREIRSREAEQYDQFIRNYMGTLKGVDENIGRLLATLEDQNLLENTTIVFTSDNGFFFGEHGGLGDKRLIYEESIRIPMIVRSPEIVLPGRISSEMALNMDVAPTFLDIAGIPILDDMHGRSLKPILNNERHSLRDAFLYEYFREENSRNERIRSIPSQFGVRTKKWKYSILPEFEDSVELYDLENDPLETENLSNDPQFGDVLNEMKKTFERLKVETGFKHSKGSE